MTPIEAYGRRIVELNVHCRGVRGLGSPALCLAYIAAGRIDAFLERDATYAWDVGAGGLMITEAGGRIEDLDGGAAQPRSRASPTCSRRTGTSTTQLAALVGEDEEIGMTVVGQATSSSPARGVASAPSSTAELRDAGREGRRGRPRRAATSSRDVSDADQVDALFGRIGAVDGLVNCAALLVNRRPYDEIPLDEWNRMLAVNVHGHVPVRAGRRGIDGRPGRQHRERRVRDRVHRLARLRPLRRVEGRRDLADAGARERDGQEEHPGELHRAGTHDDARARRSSASTTSAALRSVG